MLETVVVAIAFGALGFTLLSLRRAHEKVAALESDIDTVEGHNRTLQESRETLKSMLDETSAALEAKHKQLAETEAEKPAAEESAARLEKQRAELESEVGKLRSEHESLERRVVTFQGQWSHQLSTLEEEISTLIRQLGEFRKGTQLPIPSASPSPVTNIGTSPANADPNWALSAPVGPRLASARPRPIAADTASSEPVAARSS